MGFEGFAGEKEKKKAKEDAESREREEALNRARFGHEKNRLREEADRRREMLRLKEMVERGELAPEAVRDAARGAESREGADAAQIREAIEALERAEALPDVEKILPARIRLSPGEFRAALADPSLRPSALARVDAGLAHLHDAQWGGLAWALTFAADVLLPPRAAAAAVQESQVDAKRALKKA